MTKIKPFLFALLATVLLSACAATTFDQNLRQLEGKPINDASIQLKDQPSSTYTDNAGRKVYVFKGSDRKSIFGPAVTEGKGYHVLGDRAQSSIYWTGIEHHRCTIRATTANGIIQKITMDGDPGGCETIYGNRREELGYDSSQRP